MKRFGPSAGGVSGLMTIVSRAVSRRRLLNGGAQALGLAALSKIVIPPARANVPLRVGIQKGSSLFLLRERGDLASALRPLGFAPTFTVFPGGPRLLEELSFGSVDSGHTSDAPPIFAQAAGAPLVYVGAQPRRRRPKRSSCQASHRSARSHSLFGSCLGCEFDIGSGDMVTSYSIS